MREAGLRSGASVRWGMVAERLSGLTDSTFTCCVHEAYSDGRGSRLASIGVDGADVHPSKSSRSLYFLTVDSPDSGPQWVGETLSVKARPAIASRTLPARFMATVPSVPWWLAIVPA